MIIKKSNTKIQSNIAHSSISYVILFRNTESTNPTSTISTRPASLWESSAQQEWWLQVPNAVDALDRDSKGIENGPLLFRPAEPKDASYHHISSWLGKTTFQTGTKMLQTLHSGITLENNACQIFWLTKPCLVELSNIRRARAHVSELRP